MLIPRFCFSSGWNRLIGLPCWLLEGARGTMRCDRPLTTPTTIKLSRSRVITSSHTHTHTTRRHTHAPRRTETHAGNEWSSAFHQDKPSLSRLHPSATCCFIVCIFQSSPLLPWYSSRSLTSTRHNKKKEEKKYQMADPIGCCGGDGGGVNPF